MSRSLCCLCVCSAYVGGLFDSFLVHNAHALQREYRSGAVGGDIDEAAMLHTAETAGALLLLLLLLL